MLIDMQVLLNIQSNSNNLSNLSNAVVKWSEVVRAL